MQLPTPQFSRLVTVLAFDLNDPALDSMILAWDHIASRYLKRLVSHREVAGKVESIRLLAIHDAIHSVFATGNGYLFKGHSTGNSTRAAIAAAAQASHDVLAAVFTAPQDQADLADFLEESLSLVTSPRDASAGVLIGAASAGSYHSAFGPLTLKHQIAESRYQGLAGAAADRGGWRRSA